MPAIVEGATGRHDSTSSWRPHRAWSRQRPVRRRCSPGCTPARLPTAITSPPAPGYPSATRTATTLHASSSCVKRTRSRVPSMGTVSGSGMLRELQLPHDRRDLLRVLPAHVEVGDAPDGVPSRGAAADAGPFERLHHLLRAAAGGVEGDDVRRPVLPIESRP